MAGSVIERLSPPCSGDDGVIKFNDAPCTFERADRVAGRRLDRRKNYALINGEVCESLQWTQDCSGCEGAGCFECGYRGKARSAMWHPLRKSTL